jgi:uncharacterized protein YndB with AHSA1/START domain
MTATVAPATTEHQSRRLAPHRTVRNGVLIRCSPAVVFDYLTDLRREPEWNEQLRRVEPLTDGPIGAGSRFRVEFGHGVGEATIDYVAFEPPELWATTSASRALDVRFRGQVTPVPTGAHVVLHTELTPKGVLKPFGPVLRAVMHRAWDRHLADIKRRLEAAHPPRSKEAAR